MAQKRMFDRDVVSSDEFTEMSSDAQNLYFHLGIQADDEGFVTPKGIMRMISAPLDSLKLLITKKFVIPFDSGVVVITAWNQNNWLDNRRIRKTKFQGERQQVLLNKDNRYTLSKCLAPAKPMLVECRIGQDRIGQDRIGQTSSDVPSQDIVDIIDSFKEVNPSYSRWFGNKTERAAIRRLLEVHGKEQVLHIIGFLPKTNTYPYMPTITSPGVLERRWADLESKMAQERNKQSITRPKVIM